MKTKLSDYVMARLADEVRHVFFLPGGGCMHLVDSLRREERLTPVVCLHEQAAAVAADAYSQYTGRLGAALVTAGPGSTNAITGVAASWIDSIPVLFISGQAKSTEMIADWHVRQMGIQEVDIVSLVGPITKYAATVRDPADIALHLDEALCRSRAGRPGPVWLDVPLDVQGALSDGAQFGDREPDRSAGASAAVAGWVSSTVGLIAGARRPVVLAGNGIRLAGATGDFVSWAERAGIPILTTWKAADLLSEEHPLYVGRPGSIGQRGANFALQNADLLIALGARMDLAQVGFDYPGFAPRARKVIVDVDGSEIAKLGFPVDVAAVTDAADFLAGLLQSAEPWHDEEGWLARCVAWRRRYPIAADGTRGPDAPVDTYALIDVLSDLLEQDDVLVPGSSGSCAEITMQAFRVKAGQRVLNSPGLGSMGFGLPASIGAAVASGRRVVTVIGDGGLQHNIQELETLRRLGLPVKVFVLDNDGYASIRSSQRNHFDGFLAADPASGLTLPSIAAVAEAYGLRTFQVGSGAGLEETVRRVLASPGPAVCVLRVDPDLVTQPRLSTTVAPDGRITSRPLEDLWPFLDRDQLAANMLG
ncbi:MAG: thiamine pyrophosphate-binding protein [Actinomycetes bacterium]